MHLFTLSAMREETITRSAAFGDSGPSRLSRTAQMPKHAKQASAMTRSRIKGDCEFSGPPLTRRLAKDSAALTLSNGILLLCSELQQR